MSSEYFRFEIDVKQDFTDKITGNLVKRGDVFKTNDEGRTLDIINRKIGKLSKAHPPKNLKKSGNKIYVYQKLLYVIGGIETANQNLAREFKHRNITFILDNADIVQVLSLAQFAEVVMDNSKDKYSCDVLILADWHSYPDIKDRVKAKKIYQQIHADFAGLKKLPNWRGFEWQPDKDVDKVLTVSDTAKKGLEIAFKKPIESVVVPNIPTVMGDKSEFMIFLTLSRLSAEKGGDLIVKMIEEFHKKNKQFLWIISATPSDNDLESKLAHDKSVIFISPNIHNKGLLRNVDYLVQLSKNESYCYSVHEALSVGTPVIATKIPEFEKVINEDNGYLVGANLEDLDVDKIFTKKPKFNPLVEKVDRKTWEKILDGKL